MKEIKNELKRINLNALGYKKIGKSVIVTTNGDNVVVKNKNNKDDIFRYLNTRSFNYYPDIIDNTNYFITRYEEDIKIPKEQKIIDLVDLVSLLHSKTTHYKEVNIDDYKKIYEDLSNNLEYLYEYYLDMITIIESKVYMSPSEYLLARNISVIFTHLAMCHEKIESWYKNIENKNKMRVSIVHNNLNLSHYIKNERDYLISWDKSKIDIPIFDLYKLYNTHFIDFDFFEILKRYESNYPLKKYERELFFILILLPPKIELFSTEYENTKKISTEIDKLFKANKLVEEYKKTNQV